MVAKIEQPFYRGWCPNRATSGGHVPGKTRVSTLAKELGITSKHALEMLSELGEYVKSASSTLETPAAEALRHKCSGISRPSLPSTTNNPHAGPRGGSRSYPPNNPYMDLGKTEIDHLQGLRLRHEPPG